MLLLETEVWQREEYSYSYLKYWDVTCDSIVSEDDEKAKQERTEKWNLNSHGYVTVIMQTRLIRSIFFLSSS